MLTLVCQKDTKFGWKKLDVITNLFTGVRQSAPNRDLKHRRRGRQRERQKTIVLIRKTLALHVHYTLWYIFLPSSAKQRREMTKFKVLWRT